MNINKKISIIEKKVYDNKKYKIKNNKFSVTKFRIILNNIRRKNFFDVLGILKSSKYYVKICNLLYN